VDEVHRFNKAQQDAFLPFVEQGLLTFIGATTENPSFEVIGALRRALRCMCCTAFPRKSSATCFERAAARALGGLTFDAQARERVIGLPTATRGGC